MISGFCFHLFHTTSSPYKMVLVGLLLSLFPLTPLTAQERQLSDLVRLEQKGKILRPSGVKAGEVEEHSEGAKVFFLKKTLLELKLNGVADDETVYLFAHPAYLLTDLYTLPTAMNDTAMFSPGTGMAMRLNKDFSFHLLVDERDAHTHISPDRRVNSDEGAVIRIKGFLYPEGVMPTGSICLSIFVDFNADRVVDENEVTELIFKI